VDGRSGMSRRRGVGATQDDRRTDGTGVSPPQVGPCRRGGVENFTARPMLYNPDVLDEWMSLFYLGDVRSRREAQLVLVGP
jgi:hypothetical protein